MRLGKTVKNRSRKRFRFEHNFRPKPGLAVDFFQKCPWDRWWQEFMCARDKDGELTYITAWHFAKEKGRTSDESDWIYESIGPKRIALPKYESKLASRKPLPYLGDWQQIRLKAYFYDDESVEKMKLVVAERLDGLEAGRGAATVILDLIAKWVKYDQRIDEVFRGPVVAGLSLVQQEKQAKLFISMHLEILKPILELLDKFLLCHGIQTSSIPEFGAMVGAIAQSATRSTLQGAAAGAALGAQSPAFQLLTGAILDKVQTFSMPVPSIIDDSPGRQEEEHEAD